MSGKQPIGIELPKETIEALLNRTSKFIVPIDTGLKIHSIDDAGISFYDGETECWLTKETFIDSIAPLQIGDELYVQEEFFVLKDGVKINSEPRKIAYRDDRGSISYNNEVQIFEHLDLTFLKSSFMTPEQSRIKGKITDIQVKNTNSLSISDKSDCYQPFTGNKKLCWPDWFDEQFNENYESDPTFFLVSMEIQA